MWLLVCAAKADKRVLYLIDEEIKAWRRKTASDLQIAKRALSERKQQRRTQ